MQDGDKGFLLRRLRRLDGEVALLSINYLLPELKDIVLQSDVMQLRGLAGPVFLRETATGCTEPDAPSKPLPPRKVYPSFLMYGFPASARDFHIIRARICGPSTTIRHGCIPMWCVSRSSIQQIPRAFSALNARNTTTSLTLPLDSTLSLWHGLYVQEGRVGQALRVCAPITIVGRMACWKLPEGKAGSRPGLLALTKGFLPRLSKLQDLECCDYA